MTENGLKIKPQKERVKDTRDPMKIVLARSQERDPYYTHGKMERYDKRIRESEGIRQNAEGKSYSSSRQTITLILSHRPYNRCTQIFGASFLVEANLESNVVEKTFRNRLSSCSNSQQFPLKSRQKSTAPISLSPHSSSLKEIALDP